MAAVDERTIAARLMTATGQPDVVVKELRRMTGGATSDVWSFVTGDGARLVLRRSVHESFGGPSMRAQADGMHAALAAGVPTPRVYVVADDDPDLGAFMIMDQVDGETIARRIQRDDRFAPARARFAADTGTALACLHQADLADARSLGETDPLAWCRERLDQLGARSATFELAYRCLERNRPAPLPSCLVHGDFRLGNLVIGPEGLRSVLDWELLHLGDPSEDLGWLCTTTWRFGGPLPVGGFGTREQLLETYYAGGGAKVSIDDLLWWEMLGSLRWGVICMQQASRHFAGAPSVELAAIGRRVAEVEWDLLGLLP
jgi:aminoglycoside phosphotransferase (APT) family kinase protein